MGYMSSSDNFVVFQCLTACANCLITFSSN